MPLTFEAVSPDSVISFETDADIAPEPTTCDRGWCAPGGTQCQSCRAIDAANDENGDVA